MEYQIKYENGIANRGCLYRLKKVMDRAKAGEALNIAFFRRLDHTGKPFFQTGTLLRIPCL